MVLAQKLISINIMKTVVYGHLMRKGFSSSLDALYLAYSLNN
jgi:hypothetical protein